MKFGSVKPVTGLPHCAWLNTFCDSARISDAVVAERDRPEQREVEVPVRRSAERVAAAVAPRVARLANTRRVVPLLVRVRPRRSPASASPVTLIVCVAALLLQQAVVAADRERRARQPRAMPLICQFLTTMRQRRSSCRARTAARRRSPSAACADGRSRRARSCGELRRLVPRQARPPVVVGLVQRLAERVGALEQEAVLERTVHRHLQRVVARLACAPPSRGCRRCRPARTN